LHFYPFIQQSGLRMKDVFALIRVFFSRQPHSALWFKIFLFEDKMWFLLFEGVFKRFNAKVLIQHQEFSWVQDAQARAIESSGGIMLGFHWSNFPFATEPNHITPQHVYFVWGKMKKDWVNKKGNTCRFILPSGLWIHDNLKDSRLESLKARFDFVLAIFDTSTSPVHCIANDSMVQFYFMILGLLKEYPRWAGIVKSKSHTVEKIKKILGNEELSRKIDLLIESGRLLFLDPNTFPAVASAHADLSVCLSLNTAGLVAGEYGYRAIHWDCSSWSRHPFYGDKAQRFIYRNLEEFRQAIIQASQGNKEIGDFSRWRKSFNFFDDFQASARVGSFIQWYMEGASRGDNPHDLLGEIVSRYIIENKINEEFFSEENLWDIVENQHLREADNEVYHRV